jgi:hypothetical protein
MFAAGNIGQDLRVIAQLMHGKGEVERRTDIEHLRTFVQIRLAQTGVHQWRLVARVGANHQHHIRLRKACYACIHHVTRAVSGIDLCPVLPAFKVGRANRFHHILQGHHRIKKAQITGLAPEINASVNAGLALLPEKLAVESCEGTATAAPTGGLKVNQASADYEVAYQTPNTLTVLITYSTYGAGAEHALEGTEGFTFDLISGKLVAPIDHLKPEQVAKADGFIKHELLKKYPVALTDEAKARTEPYLTENGCDLCTMFYAKDGWVVRFQIDSIAPYAIGEPEVVIPADIIAAPETLITQTKS